MKLYLSRHGEAAWAETDRERPLSSSGSAQVNQVGIALRERGVMVEDIYHSGILRAQQTAELLAPHVGSNHIIPLSGLCPEDPVEPMVLEITTWNKPKLLVGHLPYMGYLVEALTSAWVLFDTATVVCLEGGAGSWKVQWVLQAHELP